MRFLISARLDDTGWTMSLSGEVDLAACRQLTKAIDEVLYDGGCQALVIDLGATTFLDCAGIGVLVYGRNLANERGRRYDIRNARGLPLTILQLTGILDPSVPS